MADVTLTEEERLAIQALGVVDLGMDERDLYVAVERIVAAHVAAAKREALERAVQAIEAHQRESVYFGSYESGINNGLGEAKYVVRDLMPRKDGE